MSQILYKNLRIIPILLLCGLLWRCTSANPSGAVAPAPLAEVPSLQFPETVGGEFDVTPSAPSVSGAALKAFVNEGDDISGPIADSSDNAALVTDLMDQILGPLHTLVIPSREDVHTFEDVIVIGDQLVHVKIDFNPYSNRQGIACSGNTAQVPICYRIWFNGLKSLSGFFIKSIPTATNPGDGFIQGLAPIKIIGFFPFVMGVDYDLRDPNALQAHFNLGVGEEVFEDIPETESEFMTTVHLTLEQLGPPNSALKTINATNTSFDQDGNHRDEKRHVARWREGEDFWSGTQDFAPLDDYSGSFEFFAACAQISSGQVINSSSCVEHGVDVSAIPFLDFVKIGDLQFPGDFPADPTF